MAAKIFCPNFSDQDVVEKFNDVLERLGGIALKPENITDMNGYKENLSPDQLEAFHKAYSHWNTNKGDAVKIHDFLDAQTGIKKTIPTELIRNLTPNTPRSVISDLVEGLHKLFNPEVRKLTPEEMKLFRESNTGRNKIDTSNWITYTALPSMKAKLKRAAGMYYDRIFQIHAHQRAEARNQINYQARQLAQDFTKLPLANKKNVEAIAWEGDRILGDRVRALDAAAKDAKGQEQVRLQAEADNLRALNRFPDEELAQGIKLADGRTIKLNDSEISGYKAVRSAYDYMWKLKFDTLESMEMAKYRKERWFNVLQGAFETEYDNNSIKSIIGPLNEASETAGRKMSVKVDAVFKNLQKEINGLTEEEKASASKAYDILHSKLAIDIRTLKQAISEATGESDPTRLTTVTKQVLGAYMSVRPRMNEISEMRKQQGRQVGYVPRIFEQGNTKLRILEDIKTKDKEGVESTVTKQRFMRMYSNEGTFADILKEAKADREFYDEKGILKKGFRLKTEPSRITPESSYMGVNDANTLNVITNAIEKLKLPGGKLDPDVWDELKKPLYKAIADEMNERGAGQRYVSRRGGIIKGYKQSGLDKITDQYVTGMSGMITKQIAAKDGLAVLGEMSERGDMPKAFEDISKYHSDMLRNTGPLDRFASKAKSVAVVAYLGGILRPIVVHLPQNFTIGAPALDQWMREGGIKGNAALSLAGAMRDVFGTKIAGGKAKLLNEFENRMQQELYTDGTTRDQWTREVLNRVEGEKGAMFSNIAYYLMKPFSTMIELQRQSAALGMFRVSYPELIKKGMSPEDAYKMAKEDAKAFSDTAWFVYGKANYPRLASGGGTAEIAANTAMAFRTFTFNYVNWFVGQADWKAKAMSMAYMSMWGGLVSLPLVKMVMDEIEKRTGFNARKTVQDSLKGIGGETLAKLGMYGLPAVAGANLSGTIAIGLPFLGDKPSDSVYGVWGGIVGKLQLAEKEAEMGNWWRVGESLTPEVIASPMKGIRMTMQPATTATGKPLFDVSGKPLQMSPYEGMVRAGGMQPTEYAEQAAKAKDVQAIEKYFSGQHQSIIDEFRVARGKKDPDAMKDLMKKIREFNAERKSREVMQLIKPLSISQVLSASKMTPSKKQRAEEMYLSRSE